GAAEDGWGRDDIEPVVGRYVEEAAFSPVGDRPLAHLAIPPKELIVIRRRVRGEMIHDSADRPALLRLTPEGEVPSGLTGHFLGHRIDTGLVERHLLGAVLVELAGSAILLEAVLQAPVVLLFPNRKAIDLIFLAVCLPQEIAEPRIPLRRIDCSLLQLGLEGSGKASGAE